jgi:hypothetical protein
VTGTADPRHRSLQIRKPRQGPAPLPGLFLGAVSQRDPIGHTHKRDPYTHRARKGGPSGGTQMFHVKQGPNTDCQYGEICRVGLRNRIRPGPFPTAGSGGGGGRGPSAALPIPGLPLPRLRPSPPVNCPRCHGLAGFRHCHGRPRVRPLVVPACQGLSPVPILSGNCY